MTRQLGPRSTSFAPSLERRTSPASIGNEVVNRYREATNASSVSSVQEIDID
jgi:hypothetical protein